MNEKVSIRNAKVKDIPDILRLIRDLSVYEKLSHQFANNKDLLKKYVFGKKNYAEVLIADLSNKPVGFALFFHNYSTFVGKPGVYLEDLFVLPEFRGKGIGKKLFMEIVKIAHNRDCGRIEWSVLNWNSLAIDFYKSLGAVAMDDWTVYRLDENKINFLSSEYVSEKV